MTKPNAHFQTRNRSKSEPPPFCFDAWGPPDVHGVNIYKMLSPNQYFTQPKSATEPERVDYWIPGDQSHPQGVWFAFQLFWHGFGVMHCMPLKVNCCRLRHVANLQQRAARCSSRPTFDSCCAAGAEKARLRKGKKGKKTKNAALFPSVL